MKESDLKPGDIVTVVFTDAVVLSNDRGHLELQTAHSEITVSMGAPDVRLSNHWRPVEGQPRTE